MTSKAAPSGIPPFEVSPLDIITPKIEQLQASYRTNKTKDLEYRRVQLRKLYWALRDNDALIKEAMLKDLRKVSYEVEFSELAWCQTECLDMINNLSKWTKDQSVVNVPLQFRAMGYRLRFEPLGTLLIIGAYNYPFQLNMLPVIGAIAAGNCVVLKPSESSPNCAMVLKKIFDEALDPECFVCFNGRVDETKKILESKFNKIVFTGGQKTGKIIAQKAAETLTPVLLELGGCNPAFVTKNANVKLAARRLMWSKCLNAGQVCLSQNYALVERSVLNQFIAEINKCLREFMPKGTKASPDYARVVNKAQFDRLKGMLDNTKGRIVMGGATDEAELFIEPTAVLVEDSNDVTVREESFGPVWSILPFDTLDQAIATANDVDPTPLSLMTFGSDAENDKVLRSVTSGGATCNDAYTHASIGAPPFGGVGQSGMGSYHGYYSIVAFSHQRTICKVPGWVESVLRVRYMPYINSNLNMLRLLAPKPNFDRNGKVSKGLGYYLGRIFGLGGN